MMKSRQKRKLTAAMPWGGGLLFTFAVALAGQWLAKLPWIAFLGPMLASILIAVAYRQAAGYPEKVRPGIDFTTKKILRLAIIMYGFKLNVAVIVHDGLSLLAKDALVIVMALTFTMAAAKWLKADRTLSLLLAVGTGVCGAAAIAAVSPIVSAKEEDTAIGVGIIALTGTVFAAVYTMLHAFMGIDDIAFGKWAGTSLHEIAHVVAAAAPAGEDALAVALLAKLGRVFLLIPLCFVLTYWVKKKQTASGQAAGKSRAAFPWFLLGFVISSLVGTYTAIPVWLLNVLTVASTFLLTAAMVGLGLNVSFRAVRDKALRPAAAMLAASVLIAVISFYMSRL